MKPTVNVEEVAGGVIGVLAIISAAIQQFGVATVAYFLELVPERGEALWLRFKKYQKENLGAGFDEFIKFMLTKDPIKLFYPKECTLDQFTRGMLVPEVQNAIRGKTGRNEDVLQIYYGEGVLYEAARSITCRGCPMTACKHYVRR